MCRMLFGVLYGNSSFYSIKHLYHSDASGEIRRWHITTGKCLHTHKEETQALACGYSSKGDQSIASGSNGKIYMFDEETGNVLHVFEPR